MRKEVHLDLNSQVLYYVSSRYHVTRASIIANLLGILSKKLSKECYFQFLSSQIYLKESVALENLIDWQNSQEHK